MASSCYGTLLSQLWNCNIAQLWNTWRVKSYVFHWWHTNSGSMTQLWNTQKSLFHSRNTQKSLKLQYGPAMEHLRRVKSYVFHWWHTNLGSMAQLWNTQKSLFHSRNTIFWQTPAMETVKFLTKKLRKHSNFLGFFYFHSHCHIYNLGS